jgi:hypothetical protein
MLRCTVATRSMLIPSNSPYSYRNATNGSTRVARRAGKKHAAKPTATTIAATPPNVQGSVTETPGIAAA